MPTLLSFALFLLAAGGVSALSDAFAEPQRGGTWLGWEMRGLGFRV